MRSFGILISLDDITVCLIHFNRPYLLKQVLPSYLEFKNFFIWDNDSQPQNKILIKALAKKNKNIKIFWNDENVGWPKAINRMVTMSPTDWVLIAADDMLLGKDFLHKTQELLEWKPNLEQIYLHTFDCMLFHKKTFYKIGWWEERQGTRSPTAEDDDWYLRLVEHLGFSPYVYPGDHIQGEERQRRLKFASTQKTLEREDNISYFSNCRWGISKINYEIKELTRDTSYQKYQNKNKEKGIDFHLKKWKRNNFEAGLLNKDGTFWERQLEDIDFYPEHTKMYGEKFL